MEDYRALLLPSFAAGVGAVREVIQRGLKPATIRLSDEEETRSYIALAKRSIGLSSLKERLGRWLLARKGLALESGALLILGCEGEREEVQETRVDLYSAEAALAERWKIE